MFLRDGKGREGQCEGGRKGVRGGGKIDGTQTNYLAGKRIKKKLCLV